MSTEQGLSLEVERRVKGSPVHVFDYFIDPEKYRRWKGADAELDPRPGGSYRITMAPGVHVRGEYLVVKPPRRLLLTWGFESALPLPDGIAEVPVGSTTVEYSFEPDGDHTIIRVRHNKLPTPTAHQVHGQGWDLYLSRLAVLLEGGELGEDPALATYREARAALEKG